MEWVLSDPGSDVCCLYLGAGVVEFLVRELAVWEEWVLVVRSCRVRLMSVEGRWLVWCCSVVMGGGVVRRVLCGVWSVVYGA